VPLLSMSTSNPKQWSMCNGTWMTHFS